MSYLKYFIAGETPAKKNSRIINTKTGRSFPSKKYTEWHESAVIQVLRQEKPKAPIDYPIFITLTFTHGDNRRRDSDNGVSSILDMLVDAHILEDDNYNIVREIKVNNLFEKNNPSCLVEIVEL